MTARARITQADEERTYKALKAAGIERARVVKDLTKGRIAAPSRVFPDDGKPAFVKHRGASRAFPVPRHGP